MCQSAVLAAQAAAQSAGAAPAGVKGAEPVMAAKQKFISANGEKTSAALARWAEQSGYSLVWEAPAQTDLLMNAGVMDGAGFVETVGKLIAGLNIKLESKRRSNDAEAPWSLPLEALSYSNRVVRIVVKQ